MTLRIGIVGCGNISTIYFTNAPKFADVEVVACADVREDAARAQGARFGVPALSVAELMERPDVDLVVNLTVPVAHHPVSLQALHAGKHVFSEKPLATSVEQGRELVALAQSRGLRLGVAPDTFMGAGARAARELIESGRVGQVVAGTAFVMSRGMEHWHPDPDFFFKPGGGPALDLGPYYITTLVNLLGPVRTVQALNSIGLPERTVTAEGPKIGSKIRPETPTTTFALLGFASGAVVTVCLSWDVFAHSHPPIELYGLNGSLRVPDPNFFGGAVEFTEGRGAWQTVDTSDRTFGSANYPADAPVNANYRVLGIADLAAAIREGRPHRASGELGLHVLEVLFAMLGAGQDGAVTHLSDGVQPLRFTEEEAARLVG